MCDLWWRVKKLYSRLPCTQFNKYTLCITLTGHVFKNVNPNVFDRARMWQKNMWASLTVHLQCKQKWHAKPWPKTRITLGIIEMKWAVSLCMLINKRLLKQELHIACTNGVSKSEWDVDSSYCQIVYEVNWEAIIACYCYNCRPATGCTTDMNDIEL